MKRMLRRLRNLARRGALEQEAAEEMRQHIELEIEERIRFGASAAEARRTALRDFGAYDRWQEEARSARGWGGLDELRQDLRYGLRSLAGAPGFTAAAVLTLAVGIGVNTAVFSVVNGVLLRPLGYPDPDRVVRLLEDREEEVGTGRGTISYANFADMRERARLWEAAAAYDEWQVSMSFESGAERYDGAMVDASYFEVLGVRPLLGRFFGPEEAMPGAVSRMVLSWGFWQERFGGDPGVIGRVLTTNGYPTEVIGVAPPFEDPVLSGTSFEPPRFWRSPGNHFLTNSRGARSFTAIVRLKPDVTLAQAQQEIDALEAQLVAEYPEHNAERVARVEPLKETIIGDVRFELLVLLGAVGLVLVIACANVGNLLLVRATAREREITVRNALGASRARVVRQLLVESSLLAMLGALLGGALAGAGTRTLTRYVAQHLPRAAEVTLDARLLGFTLLLTVAATLLFGLIPALHGARADLGSVLRAGDRSMAGSRRVTRLRSLVVATEVAVAILVLVSAGLLTRSLLRLQAVDPGIDTGEQVISLSLATSDLDGAELTSYYERLLPRMQALPGVHAAGLVDILPLSGSFNGGPFTIVGEPEPAPHERPSAELRAVSPGYFAVMGLALERGRLPDERDDGNAPSVVVVSRALAERYFPGGNAIGQRVYTYEAERTIVGVVADVTQFTLDEVPGPTLYFPHAQAPEWMRYSPELVVRVDREAAAVMPELRAAARAVDRNVAIADVRTMRSVVDATLVLPRFRTILLSLFALIAFTLAVIGIYGTISYAVARRAREFGIRIALGARRADILALVLGRGLRPVLAGIGIGVVLALAATRVLQSMMFEISTLDVRTFVAVPVTLLAVAAVAATLPAARAARAGTMRTLRED